MGIFENIVGAMKETNEAAHGARLKKDVFATLDLLHQSRPDVETEGLMLYLKLQRQILLECHSWSRDGFLKAAGQLQAEAKKHKDFEVGKACGYYLAGAFCECMGRESVEAKMVLTHLDSRARELPADSRTSSPRKPAAGHRPDMLEMVDKCMTGVFIALFWPVKDERSANDFVPRMRELTDGGREAIVGVAFGLIDGLCQKAGFDQAETLAIAAVFMGGTLTFTEEAVPAILKDMMAESATNEYVALGGKAAFDFAMDPTSLKSLSDCGFEVRKRIDASPLW